MHLRQLYRACGPFTKNKQIIKKVIETGDSRYIYQNGLDKVCFQHNIAYGDFKDLTIKESRTPNMNLLQWFLNFAVQKISCSGIKNENISNKELEEKLHKLII